MEGKGRKLSIIIGKKLVMEEELNMLRLDKRDM